MDSSSIDNSRTVSPPPVLSRCAANRGRTLHAFGETFVILLDGKQTGEKLTAFLSISPPGGGPPPHYHDNEDEWFYIVESGQLFS